LLESSEEASLSRLVVGESHLHEKSRR
jgi:hypothetical protein